MCRYRSSLWKDGGSNGDVDTLKRCLGLWFESSISDSVNPEDRQDEAKRGKNKHINSVIIISILLL